MSYLFVFRGAPDLDHIAPLAWKLLEGGHDVHAVVSPRLAEGDDHRITLLQGYPRFHLHRSGSYLRHTLPYALWLLTRHRVRSVSVEWGSGLPEGYEKPLSPRGVVATLRTLAASLSPKPRDPHQTRTLFMAAARLLRIPTYCLPHGLNVKLDAATNESLAAILARGPLSWDDRNRFTAFVLNTEHHRQWYIDHAGGDPDVMQTWGSLRWSPEWFELNRRLAPPYAWAEEGDRLRVVYMVPKWGNRVDAQEAVRLLERIYELDFVSLAVMGHPRTTIDAAVANGDAGDPLGKSTVIDWDRVVDATKANSVSLIESCDVVVDVGSSIGIEVLMQGKTLVNPTYIHELTTLFDTIEGAAVVAHTADEVVGYLEAHAAGSPHRAGDEAYAELMRQAVYGSRPAPFDVLDEYASRLTQPQEAR